MFCPDVEDTSNLLLAAFNQMQKIKSFASTCDSLRIGKPGDVDPDWLVEVRSRVRLLSDSMGLFMNEKSVIFANLLYPFVNYQTLFSAFAQNQTSIRGNENWLKALTSLEDALNNAIQLTDVANLKFQRQYQDVSNIRPLIDASIEKGWVALGEEEKAMIEMATAFGALHQAVIDMSNDLQDSDIRNGKSYVQTSVSIAYSIVTSTAMTIPYLSFASLVFTIGYSLYDVFATSAEIRQKLDEIEDLQNKSTAEAQALAATKGTLQVIYRIESAFDAIGSSLPRLSAMWKAEREKVVNAINAIHAGSDPALYFDIQTMKIANATWTSLFQLAQSLQTPPTVGHAVAIQTHSDADSADAAPSNSSSSRLLNMSGSSATSQAN